MAEIILLEKHIFISQGNETQITILFTDLDALFASLYPHYYSFPRSLCTTHFHAKVKKRYQKSFHFHLTHQYLPLIMSKRISKKIIKSRWVGHKKVFKGSAWCICFIFSWPKKVVEVHSKNLSFQRLWRNQLLKLPNEGVLSNIGIFKVCILKKSFVQINKKDTVWLWC